MDKCKKRKLNKIERGKRRKEQRETGKENLNSLFFSLKGRISALAKLFTVAGEEGVGRFLLKDFNDPKVKKCMFFFIFFSKKELKLRKKRMKEPDRTE